VFTVQPIGPIVVQRKLNQKAASQIADLKIKYTYPVIGFQEILFDKELKRVEKKRGDPGKGS